MQTEADPGQDRSVPDVSVPLRGDVSGKSPND